MMPPGLGSKNDPWVSEPSSRNIGTPTRNSAPRLVAITHQVSAQRSRPRQDAQASATAVTPRNTHGSGTRVNGSATAVSTSVTSQRRCRPSSQRWVA